MLISTVSVVYAHIFHHVEEGTTNRACSKVVIGPNCCESFHFFVDGTLDKSHKEIQENPLSLFDGELCDKILWLVCDDF